MADSREINDILSNYSDTDTSSEASSLSDEECISRHSESRILSSYDEQLPLIPPRERIKALKQRYTRRISLFEMTGILCESYNLLQRGRIPLINDLSNETFKKSLLETMLTELEQGNCPIIIQKNGELLSLTDFDPIGVKYHLDYIKSIWMEQQKL